MSWLLDALRRHPEVAFFVTLGIGYALGRLRLGNFQLGAVTGTLAWRRPGRAARGEGFARGEAMLLHALSVSRSATAAARNSSRGCGATGCRKRRYPPL